MAFVMVVGSSILTYIGKKSTNKTCPILAIKTPEQFSDFLRVDSMGTKTTSWLLYFFHAKNIAVMMSLLKLTLSR